MNIKTAILGAAMGAVGLASSALAGTVTPPGERAGIDLASPLPEGVYFVDFAGVGNNRSSAYKTSGFDYNVPIIAWATPWTIFGGRIQLLYAQPEASVSFGQNQLYARGIYNPFVAGQYAYNFGNGFSASYLAGAYIGIDSPNNTGPLAGAWNQTTFHQQLALAYHGGGWNATANLMYGIVGNNNTSGLQNSNYFNYDLGLTHTFGKWEIGIIGYGSVTSTISAYYHYGYGYRTYIPYTAGNNQFALGGLVGYNFGPVIMQFSLSTDVTSNYPSKATFAGLHVVVPLWNPEAPAPVVAKY
jgi:hypothetical protein